MKNMKKQVISAVLFVICAIMFSCQNKQYIKDGIKRELLTAFINDSVSTAFSLKQDKQLNEAIKYLSDMNLYKKAISAPDKRAKKSTKESKKK